MGLVVTMTARRHVVEHGRRTAHFKDDAIQRHPVYLRIVRERYRCELPTTAVYKWLDRPEHRLPVSG